MKMPIAIYYYFLILHLFLLGGKVSVAFPGRFVVTSDSDMENIEKGLLLMAVGMLTVFAILLIVINLGKGLILLVNKYAPEEVVVKKAAPSRARVAAPVVAQAAPAPVMGGCETAAIVSAVSVLTAGQGKVVKIEKI